MAKSIAKPKTPTAPKRLTKKFLQERDDVNEERLRLRREADAASKELAEYDAQIKLYVEANCSGKVRRVETCGFELAIEQKPKTPAWKTFYEKIVGKDQVEADKQNAGTRDVLAVRKVA